MGSISAGTLITILILVIAVLAILLIIAVIVALIMFVITTFLIMRSCRNANGVYGGNSELSTLVNNVETSDNQTYDKPHYAPPKTETIRSDNKGQSPADALQKKRFSNPGSNPGTPTLRSPSSSDKLSTIPRNNSSSNNLKDYQSQNMPRNSSQHSLMPRSNSGANFLKELRDSMLQENSDVGDDLILKEDTSGHSEYYNTPSHLHNLNSFDAVGGLVLPGRNGEDEESTPSSAYGEIGNSGGTTITQTEALCDDFAPSVVMAEKLKFVSVIAEQLELLEQVGSGSSSQVFKAVYFGAIVAVKKCLICDLLEDPLKDYMKETDILSSLNHPNIIKFYGASLQPPYFYIITEFCEYGSLDRYVKTASTIAPAQDGQVASTKKQFTMMEKVRIMLETAMGMAYLQSLKVPIVHRDLKLANLLVDSNWTIKVTDFGVSNFLNKERKMTKVGTIETQAPEVIKDGQYSKKTDVYSYGVIMWEFFFEKELYPGLSIYEIQSKVVGQNMRPIIPNQNLPKNEILTQEDKNKRPPMQLISLMKKCWDKNPKNRPSFKKLVTEMEAIYHEMLDVQN